MKDVLFNIVLIVVGLLCFFGPMHLLLSNPDDHPLVVIMSGVIMMFGGVILASFIFYFICHVILRQEV